MLCRPQALSALADLLYSLVAKLSPAQLQRTISAFGSHAHDATLGTGAHHMMIRILFNIVEPALVPLDHMEQSSVPPGFVSPLSFVLSLLYALFSWLHLLIQ